MTDLMPVDEIDDTTGALALPAEPEADYSALTLEELGATISTLHKDANYFVEFTRKVAACSVKKAVAAGAALLAAKSKVKHGEWGPWLQQHVPSLSQDTANRYMKLSKQITHVRNFDENVTLRQAFLLAGVIKTHFTDILAEVRYRVAFIIPTPHTHTHRPALVHGSARR